MSWIRLDDDFAYHPKIGAISDRALRVYIMSLCYASKFRTDGFISVGALQFVLGTDEIAAELVAAGLWEPADRGWVIHDYLDYNLSRAELEGQSRRRSEKASSAASARWNSRQRLALDADAHEGDASSDPQTMLSACSSDAEQHAQSDAQVMLERCLDDATSHSHTHTHTHTRTQEDLDLAAAARGRARHELVSGPEVQATSPAATTGFDDLSLLIQHWERATGTTVTPMLTEWLDSELGRGTPAEWLRDAITETGANGAKAWKYTRAIIERWRVHGRDSPAPAGERATRTRPQEANRGQARERAERSWADDPILAEWRAAGIISNPD